MKELILDMIKHAKENEIKIHKFYSDNAERAVNNKIKEKLTMLANIEKNHLTFLDKQLKIFAILKKFNIMDTSILKAIEEIENMNKSIVLTDEEQQSLSFLNEVELIKKAVDYEKEEIRLYSELRVACSDKDGKRIFERLMDEEEKQHEFLSNLLNEMLGTNTRKTTVNHQQMFDDYTGRFE